MVEVGRNFSPMASLSQSVWRHSSVETTILEMGLEGFQIPLIGLYLILQTTSVYSVQGIHGIIFDWFGL